MKASRIHQMSDANHFQFSCPTVAFHRQIFSGGSNKALNGLLSWLKIKAKFQTLSFLNREWKSYIFSWVFISMH